MKRYLLFFGLIFCSAHLFAQDMAFLFDGGFVCHLGNDKNCNWFIRYGEEYVSCDLVDEDSDYFYIKQVSNVYRRSHINEMTVPKDLLGFFKSSDGSISERRVLVTKKCPQPQKHSYCTWCHGSGMITVPTLYRVKCQYCSGTGFVLCDLCKLGMPITEEKVIQYERAWRRGAQDLINSQQSTNVYITQPGGGGIQSSDSRQRSTPTSQRRKCNHCTNGRIKHYYSTSTFGQSTGRTRCSECGEYMTSSTMHGHVTCNYCGGTGYQR